MIVLNVQKSIYISSTQEAEIAFLYNKEGISFQEFIRGTIQYYLDLYYRKYPKNGNSYEEN